MPRLTLARANEELQASGLTITRGTTAYQWWLQRPNAGAVCFPTLEAALRQARALGTSRPPPSPASWRSRLPGAEEGEGEEE